MKRTALRSVGVVLALVACSPKLKGSLEWNAGGQAVAIRVAYFVPQPDTQSFRVYVSSVAHDCDWAERQGVGSLQNGELSGSIDVAPVVALDGSASFRVVGAGWVTAGETTAPSIGNVGIVQWPADVAPASGCNRHIAISQTTEKPLQLRGDFEAVCCQPSTPAVHVDSAMTARLGNKVFPLGRASAKQEKDGTWAVRVSRALAPCSDIVTGADVFVDLRIDAAFGKVTSANASGMVTPSFGYTATGDAVGLTVSRTPDAVLQLDGLFHGRSFGVVDGPALDVDVHGHVPLTACPAGL